MPQRSARIVGALALAALGAVAHNAVAQNAVAPDDSQRAAAPSDAPKVASQDDAPRGNWDLIVSPYTYHFHPSDDHKYVYSLGLLRRLENNWVAGGIAFSNSFGQPSFYAFVGQRYVEPFGWKKWYLQWTGGLLYGYVGEFKDKVPFNNNGFSPGFVPSIGYQFSDRVYGELDLLGNSALMFTLVFPLPKSLE